MIIFMNFGIFHWYTDIYQPISAMAFHLYSCMEYCGLRHSHPEAASWWASSSHYPRGLRYGSDRRIQGIIWADRQEHGNRFLGVYPRLSCNRISSNEFYNAALWMFQHKLCLSIFYSMVCNRGRYLLLHKEFLNHLTNLLLELLTSFHNFSYRHIW